MLGNERSAEQVQQKLRALGVDFIVERDTHVHFSGHPARDDLRRLYECVQPPAVIPVHGAPRHRTVNAEIAQACSVPAVGVVGNGDLCGLNPDGAELPKKVRTGRLTLRSDGRLEAAPSTLLAEMRAKVQ